MNVYDSNRILDMFKDKNYEISENPKDANLVVSKHMSHKGESC